MNALNEIKRFPSQFYLICYLILSFILHLLILSIYYYANNIHLAPQKPQERKYYYVKASLYNPATMGGGMRQARSKLRVKDKVEIADKRYDLSRLKKNLFRMPQTLQDMSSPPKIRSEKTVAAIHLVGEKLLNDPFLKLLGRAITAHLYYPEVAKELNLRGIVTVKFILAPNGEVSALHVIKSSRKPILDSAALNAIKNASPMQNVDLYLKEPRDIVINFIF